MSTSTAGAPMTSRLFDIVGLFRITLAVIEILRADYIHPQYSSTTSCGQHKTCPTRLQIVCILA